MFPESDITNWLAFKNKICNKADIAKLSELFTSLGISFEVATSTAEDRPDLFDQLEMAKYKKLRVITIRQGINYFHDFCFDNDGKFVANIIWE